MQRRFWILTAALILALPIGLALAQPGGDGPGRRGGRGMQERGRGDGGPMRMFDRLDLSDRQKEQIKKVREGGEATRLQVHKQVLRLRNRLHGEMLEDTPNKTQIMGLVDQIDAARAKLHKQHIEQWLEVRAVLTPEQRDKMLTMPGAMGPHGRHGRRGPQGRMGGHGHMGLGLMGFDSTMEPFEGGADEDGGQ